MSRTGNTHGLTQVIHSLETRALPAGLLAPASISEVVINEGAIQRSQVTAMRVTFDTRVALPEKPQSAFTLIRLIDKAPIDLSARVVDIGGPTAVELRFSGVITENKSLADGRYRLTALAELINGGNFDGNGDGIAGDDYELNGSPENGLFRLFGDMNGDTRVASDDLVVMRQLFGTVNYALDSDGDGFVSAVDFIKFRQRFGRSI